MIAKRRRHLAMGTNKVVGQRMAEPWALVYGLYSLA